MICQPVIFKKAKKVCEDPEKAGNEENVDLNVHVCPNAAYIWKKQIRTRICRKREEEMKGKKPAMIGFFYGWLQKSFKNRQKKFEKGIDRRTGLRYNNQAVSASETPSGQR